MVSVKALAVSCAARSGCLQGKVRRSDTDNCADDRGADGRVQSNRQRFWAEPEGKAAAVERGPLTHDHGDSREAPGQQCLAFARPQQDTPDAHMLPAVPGSMPTFQPALGAI